MANYKARGIVIRRDNFGEADRRVTILTDRLGKVIVLAKGSRRPKSKLASAVNLFTEIDFVAAQSKSIDILLEAQITDSHSHLTDDLLRVKYAYWLAELTDKIVHEGESQKEIYDLLRQTLLLLEKHATLLAVDYFSYHISVALGYCPTLDRCAGCGQELREDDRLMFSAHAGGVTGSCCRAEDGRPIRASAVKAMRCLNWSWSRISKIDSSESILLEVHNHMKDFVETILQKQIKADRIVVTGDKSAP